VLSLNHKAHPINRIERAYFNNVLDFISAASDIEELDGLAVVQTCNRVELYIDSEMQSVPNKLIEIWESMVGDSDIHKDLLRYTGYEAIEHLFRLVCGLESMAVGENEITHQIREAYKLSHKVNMVSNVLRYIFEEAFKVGRIVRNKTYLGHKRISLADIGVEYCEDYFIDLNDKVIIVIGAGEVGSKVIESLARKRDRKLTIIIANRTYERAVLLATKVGGIALHLDKLDDYLKIADVIFVTTKAPHYIIKRERVEKALEARDKTLLIIDLSMPTNVDPSIAKLEKVSLVGIEDLKRYSNVMDDERYKLLTAEKMIQEYAWKAYMKLSNLWIDEILRNINKYADDVRNEKINEFLRLLGKDKVDEEFIKLLDNMTRSLVKKILHPYNEIVKNIYRT